MNQLNKKNNKLTAKDDQPDITPPDHTKEPPVVEPEVPLPKEPEIIEPKNDPLPAKEPPSIKPPKEEG